MKGRLLFIFTLCLFFCISEAQAQKLAKVRFKYPSVMKRGRLYNIEMEMLSRNTGFHNSRNRKGYITKDIYLNSDIVDKQKLFATFTPHVFPNKDCSDHILMAKPYREIDLSAPNNTTTLPFAIDDDFPLDVDSIIMAINMAGFFIDYVTMRVDNSNLKVILTKNTTSRNYNLKPLFSNSDHQTRCKEEFLSFIKDEYYPDSIFPNRKSITSMAFVSFIKKWRREGLLDAKSTINPYACYRFLTVDCELKCNPKHDIKRYSNFLRHELSPDVIKKSVRGNKDDEVAKWLVRKGQNQ